MMNRAVIVLRVWILAVGLGVTSSAAFADPYTFTKIAHQDDILGSQGFPAGPSINNKGEVAFNSIGGLGGIDSGYGVFVGDGVSLQMVSTARIGTGHYVPINDQGLVAFRLGDTIVRTDGATSIAAFVQGLDNGTDPVRTITTDGRVVSSAGNGSSIVLIDGGTPQTLIDDSGSFRRFHSSTLNEAGAVYFWAEDGQQGRGIFTLSDGVVTPIMVSSRVDPSSPFDAGEPLGGSQGSFGVNDHGDIIFTGLTAEGIGVYVSRGGVVTRVVETSGAFDDISGNGPLFVFARGVDINNQGDIAFVARLDSGVTGIFAGPDSVNDLVVLTGDTLFGRTITQLRFVPGGLNDRGQIAFFAVFDDGTRGVYRADPVPEPAIVALFVLGAAVAWRRRRKTRSF